MPSLVSPSLVVLLALLASVLLVSLPPASGQPGCFPCVVSSCASYFNGSAPNVSIGATASSIAAAECNTLNTDIGLFISTAQGAACQANVAQLACQVIATVNATEVNCNTSSIGVGTPFGNQTYFQQRCSSAVSCLGYTYQDEVNAANACNSFSTFLGTIIAQPTPSTVACAPCNITSCYGLSTIGVTDVTFWAGSLPGLSGFACPAQQAVASALLAGGNAAVPASAVQQAVCNPLAALTLPQAGDTQAACNAGLLDQVFDGIIFNGASQMNMTWTQDCLATIPQLFQPALATNLINANYCTSPSLGLTNYANKFLLSNSSQSSSSTGGGAPTPSGGAGCFPCVVSSCATFFNGSAPKVSIGATASSIAAAECNTLNTDIGLFISTAQGAACQANVAQLACQVIATVNATEVNCNTSSIGVGTPFGNQTYFQQRCSSAVSCLGYTYQDEVNAANACNSFSTFLGAIIAQPTPSTVPCAPCNITACYGLSTIGVTDVTYWAGSVPGVSGSACSGQQAVAAALLAGGNAAVPLSAVQQAVCNPLAALTLPQAGDTQAACNAGALDQVLDGIIFNGASQMNMTWTQQCLATIPFLFQPALATNLINANYCTSPSLGLTNYANRYLLASPRSSSSSTGGGPGGNGASSSAQLAVPTLVIALLFSFLLTA